MRPGSAGEVYFGGEGWDQSFSTNLIRVRCSVSVGQELGSRVLWGRHFQY